MQLAWSGSLCATDTRCDEIGTIAIMITFNLFVLRLAPQKDELVFILSAPLHKQLFLHLFGLVTYCAALSCNNKYANED